MLGVHDYAVFLSAGILLNLTPGQDTFYIVGCSLAGGQRVGVASALGIGAGSVVHTCFAALGLSAILATWPAAFAVVRALGAAYLVYLGCRLLLARSVDETSRSRSAPSDVGAAFRKGVLTNLLNPKVALFFLAFMPQFIDPSAPTKIAAFLFLGASFITTGLIWCLVLAVGAARVRAALLARAGAAGVLTRVSGALFVALGLRLATSSR